MQQELKASFGRVDDALKRLADSIASYNPDVRAAEDLAAADAAVDAGLKKLVTHQRNHVRKTSLQRQTDAYDAEIRRKIRSVADARKELVAIPAYDGAEEGLKREVEVQELLRYAKYISRTTTVAVPGKAEDGKAPAAQQQQQQQQQVTNGTAVGTPAVGGDTQMPDANGTDPAPAAAAAALAAEEEEEEHPTIESKYLSTRQRRILSTTRAVQVWPDWAMIQSGALGEIQRMVEEGRDPAGVLSREEREEVERLRREEEEREKGERERWAVERAERERARVVREEEEEVFNPDEI